MMSDGNSGASLSAGGGGGESFGAASSSPTPAGRVVTGQHPLAEEAERVAYAMDDKLADALGLETPPATTTPAAVESPLAAVESPLDLVEPTPDAVGPTPAAGAGGAPAAVTAGGASRESEAAGGGAEAARGAGVLGRAAGVGARAGESLRPGVDRLRGAVVAFDESSSDDPGLRFVVIAAALFAVFLLLWLFGYVLG